MILNQIESALLQTFDDLRLSKNEKYALRDLLSDYKADIETINFTRNKAFDIAKAQLIQTPEDQMIVIKWLEHVIKVLDSVKNENIISPSEVYFSPGDECLQAIRQLIRSAKHSIDICVFTISDDRISKEIAAAFQRDIAVRVITDNDKSEDRGSDIKYLAELNVPVKMDVSQSHMHHKFALFDNEALVNGSFNWTRSASKYNAENVVVTREESLVKQFVDMFNSLWDSNQMADYA